ncbi:ribosomal protein S18-alanine N-acetyltransferase [Psychrobacter aquaticus]|uniref:Ribosomal-protein-S18p-alanine acetyltransferase n=1 Tax=Psychrobacter aquaticus CMS 56 TaxID=1354303 RepID=U4T611_9GAMM|nr:ribosomal protein S18-alanine N-acetyltransferase [Psychrobacter aquaticus]ERL56355.1 Ribosomal-protein-S18p-alanine acetyltransferase [Psychrobacter aquaticus CMS 56]
MFTIAHLPISTAKRQQVIQAVANIEALVQQHDMWIYQTLAELLEQDSINMLIVYEQAPSAIIIDNKVIGYCLYQLVFEQAEILRIGTHPDYQRQGIASRLFTKLNSELIQGQVESLLLEVRADNVPAIALYEQQAFAVIHKRKGYYHLLDQPAVDALIMQRVYTQGD